MPNKRLLVYLSLCASTVGVKRGRLSPHARTVTRILWDPKAPLVVEFHTDGDGSVVALTFTGMLDDRGRLGRIGDLPEGR